ncbi:hypothetical protein [Stenotrophomonas maltophilia]|uniref:hypothetical protein n=1 Tax=Stenotrophomonas maltophilia TaxID=40324 RepID=UPI0034545E59
MRAPVTILICVLTAAALTACDSNRDLRNEVERLREQVAQDRLQCDHAQALEARDSSEVRQRLVRIGELRADMEWDELVSAGEAGTAELLVQAKRRMSNPDYQVQRDRELESLDREVALYKQDEPRRREYRRIACDALLASNKAYRAAKAKLSAATKLDG